MKFIKKADIIIISVLILISIGFWAGYNTLNANTDAVAEIYFKSKLIKTIDLGQGIDLVFSVRENDHVVFRLFPDGSICFMKSNCPDKLCIRSGRLNLVGETAACLPNDIILKIVRKNRKASYDPDIIIGMER